MKTTTTARKSAAPVGAIYLYGTSNAGHGWIASDGKGWRDGDGELAMHRSATSALWLAVAALKDHGVGSGRVAIHMDLCGAPKLAWVDLGKRLPYFGELQWEAGTSVVVSAEAITAAAHQGT